MERYCGRGSFLKNRNRLPRTFVGFFEKSGGFVTAQELSELGVQKVMETFPVGNQVVPIAR